MTKTFTAQLRNFTEKAKRNLDLVVKEAAEGVFADMSQRQPSVKETGGSFEIGKVPVDTGFLINTMQSSLNGGTVAEGPAGYVGALEGMELGDTVTHAFTASYAPHIEYGTATMAGRFPVRQAIAGWDARVDAVAAKYKD